MVVYIVNDPVDVCSLLVKGNLKQIVCTVCSGLCDTFHFPCKFGHCPFAVPTGHAAHTYLNLCDHGAKIAPWRQACVTTVTPFLCGMEARRSDQLLLLALGFVWGSSFILMKIGLTAFSDSQVAAMRMFFALLACLPMLVQQWSNMDGKMWLKLIIPGMLGSCIPAFLFTAAQTALTSSLTGMLNSTVPVITLLIGLIFFGLRPTMVQVAGLLVGLCGALLLIVSPDTVDGFKPEAFLVLLAATCYAINLNYVRRYLTGVSTMVITAGGFVWAGVPCGVYLAYDGAFSLMFNSENLVPLAAIILLAVVGTALAVVVFNRLIIRSGPLFASMVTYIVPVFAVMWGLIDGETVRPAQLAAVGLVLGGVYLVNLKKG